MAYLIHLNYVQLIVAKKSTNRIQVTHLIFNTWKTLKHLYYFMLLLYKISIIVKLHKKWIDFILNLCKCYISLTLFIFHAKYKARKKINSQKPTQEMLKKKIKSSEFKWKSIHELKFYLFNKKKRCCLWFCCHFFICMQKV